MTDDVDDDAEEGNEWRDVDRSSMSFVPDQITPGTFILTSIRTTGPPSSTLPKKAAGDLFQTDIRTGWPTSARGAFENTRFDTCPTKCVRNFRGIPKWTRENRKPNVSIFPQDTRERLRAIFQGREEAHDVRLSRGILPTSLPHSWTRAQRALIHEKTTTTAAGMRATRGWGARLFQSSLHLRTQTHFSSSSPTRLFQKLFCHSWRARFLNTRVRSIPNFLSRCVVLLCCCSNFLCCTDTPSPQQQHILGTHAQLL